MNFKDYQDLAKTTAVYDRQFRVIYPTLGLAGETGEVAEKIKKWLRDEGLITFGKPHTPRWIELRKEIGDVLWYVAALCSDLYMDMDEIAEENISKLRDRDKRKVIHGDGDNR